MMKLMLISLVCIILYGTVLQYYNYYLNYFHKSIAGSIIVVYIKKNWNVPVLTIILVIKNILGFVE